MLTYFFNPTQYVFIKELFIPKILSCGVVVGLVFVKQGVVVILLDLITQILYKKYG